MRTLDKGVRELRHIRWCLSPGLCAQGAARLPVAARAAEPPALWSFAHVCVGAEGWVCVGVRYTQWLHALCLS